MKHGVSLISIIIPTLNEGEHLNRLLTFLNEFRLGVVGIEIIISDGGSSDETMGIAQQFDCIVIESKKGRASQMNAGALGSSGELLYFLHSDSIPPENFQEEILKALDLGFVAGCFRLKFDWSHWFLQLNAWFTRFSGNVFRFGDQSLFVTKDVFVKIGGFREDHFLMEDQEIVYRITKKGKFKVIPDYILTSARKYRKNGPFRMQLIFCYLYFSYLLGVSQRDLKRMYESMISF